MNSSTVGVSMEGGEDSPDTSLSALAHVYVVQWVTSLFGIVGNLFVLYIYGGKMPKAPSERFIIVIAAMDFAMNLFLILFILARLWLPQNLNLPLCLVSNSAYDLINTSSSLLVCWMTVNRFVAVCRPHSYSTCFTMAKVNLILSVTFLVSLCSCSLSVAICVSHFPPSGWDLEPPEHGERDIVKLIWVNLRLFLLLVAAALMAVLYRQVAVTLSEKRAKTSLKEPPPLTTCLEETKANHLHLQRFNQKDKEESNSTGLMTTNFNTGEAKKSDQTEVKEEHDTAQVSQEDKSNEIREASEQDNEASNTEGRNSVKRLQVVTMDEGSEVGKRRTSFTQQVVGKSSLRGNRHRKKTSRQSLLDQNLTMTLFAISVAYVLLMLPDVIVQLIDALNFFSDSSSFEYYRIPSQFLYGVNFVTNPVIYFICNNFFKTQLRKIFSPCFPSYAVLSFRCIGVLLHAALSLSFAGIFQIVFSSQSVQLSVVTSPLLLQIKNSSHIVQNIPCKNKLRPN